MSLDILDSIHLCHTLSTLLYNLPCVVENEVENYISK